MVNSITLDYIEEFNRLGLIVNSNFMNVYKLDDLLNSDYDYVYGYYEDSKLLGFIHINKLYETMDIVNIVVDEDYRKKGIASSLIDYVVKLFSDVESIMLEVNENNLSAISLYKKNNFEVINKRNNYYGSDAALIMKRDVKNERC